MSVVRMAVGVLPAILLAWALYAYNLFTLGPVLILFFDQPDGMGWWVALGGGQLILRHGAGAEALAWSVLFGADAVLRRVYPVSVLPGVAAAAGTGAAVCARIRGPARAAAARRIAWGHMAWASVSI